MYIQDELPEKGMVVAEALKAPRYRKTKTYEDAARCVGDTVKKTFMANLSQRVFDEMLDVVAMYEVINGDFADLPKGDEGEAAREDYTSGLDDQVEKYLEPYDAHLSADWLGRMTIDTGLWDDEPASERPKLRKFASSVAGEVYKQLTYELSPAKVLSNAGILEADIREQMETQKEPEPMAEANDLDAVIAKMKAHIGKDYDQLGVFEDLEYVTQNDEIMMAGALPRLGIDAKDAEVLQIAAMTLPNPQEILDKLNAASAAPAKGGKRQTKAQKAEEKAEKGSAIDASILAALKECGAPDTATAEKLGISRTTYTSYVKGKSSFSPDADQYATIREELVSRLNKLHGALGSLDGVDPQEVA